MKQKMPLVPILILLLTLLCGTALALISHFSVRDYHESIPASIPLEENITTIQQTYENDSMIFSFGDALFDGQNFTIAFTLTPKHPTERVLLYPTLTATCDGIPLNTYMYSGVDGIDQGLLYPNLNNPEGIHTDFGIEAIAYDDTQVNFGAYTYGSKPSGGESPMASHPVAWTLRFQTLSPHRDPFGDAPGEDERQSQWEALLAGDVYALMDYAYRLAPPEGMDGEAWDVLAYPDRLLAAGLFSLVDTVDCVFETPVPDSTRMSLAAGVVVPMDGYSVTMDSIYSSFLRIGYLLHIDLPKGAVSHDLLAQLEMGGCYEAFTAEGETAIDFLSYGGFVEDLEGGGLRLNFQADGYPTGPLPESLTFIPFTQGEDGSVRYHEEGRFTIPLTQGG